MQFGPMTTGWEGGVGWGVGGGKYGEGVFISDLHCPRAVLPPVGVLNGRRAGDDGPQEGPEPGGPGGGVLGGGGAAQHPPRAGPSETVKRVSYSLSVA